MDWLAAIVVTLSVPIGLMLVVLALPGIWLMLAVAAGCQWWTGGAMFHPATLWVCLGLGVIAEIVELLASAVGTSRAGGTKTGAMGALAGGLVGAIAGTPLAPPIGTILGGAAGAGLGALAAEKLLKSQSWSDAARIAAGAAVGRLVATVVKVLIAALIGLILTVAAWWP